MTRRKRSARHWSGERASRRSQRRRRERIKGREGATARSRGSLRVGRRRPRRERRKGCVQAQRTFGGVVEVEPIAERNGRCQENQSGARPKVPSLVIVLVSLPLCPNSTPTEQFITALVLLLAVLVELFDGSQVLAIPVLELLHHQ